jgi:hypothetical protein
MQLEKTHDGSVDSGRAKVAAAGEENNEKDHDDRSGSRGGRSVGIRSRCTKGRY